MSTKKSPIAAIAASVDAMQQEIERLRAEANRLNDENSELRMLLDESGYRRRHQIEDDGGPEEIRVESGRLALELSIQSKQAKGLEVYVSAFDGGKIVVSGFWSETDRVLSEAGKRADAIIAHDWGFLRPEMTRADIVAVLEDQLRWAHACLRPHPEKPGKKQGWGMTR